ncbi:MAG TPA: hypothetical protein PL124_07895 [Candidatus Cloacimonadota bacterium]|nr:hypothetical protein [Candidatus Cloacimonadota bacterium]
MNAKEYLQKAEKPKIIVIDDDGNELEMDLKNAERPSLQDLRKICARQTSFGRVTFVDTFEVTIPKACHVSKAILYYDTTQVGMREFPSIYMMSGDDLVLKFALTIVVDHAQVKLGE